MAMTPDWPVVIRQIIAATDASTNDLAQHCGVSPSAVRQWMRGDKRPGFGPGWELLNAYVANVSRSIPQR